MSSSLQDVWLASASIPPSLARSCALDKSRSDRGRTCGSFQSAHFFTSVIKSGHDVRARAPYMADVLSRNRHAAKRGRAGDSFGNNIGGTIFQSSLARHLRVRHRRRLIPSLHACMYILSHFLIFCRIQGPLPPACAQQWANLVDRAREKSLSSGEPGRPRS